MIQGLPKELDFRQLPEWLRKWYEKPNFPPEVSDLERLKKWVESGEAPALLVKATLLFYNGSSEISLTMAKHLPAEMIDDEIIELCTRSGGLACALTQNPNTPSQAKKRIEEVAAAWLSEYESRRNLLMLRAPWDRHGILQVLQKLSQHQYEFSETTYDALLKTTKRVLQEIESNPGQYLITSEETLKLIFGILKNATHKIPKHTFDAYVSALCNSHRGVNFLVEHPQTAVSTIRALIFDDPIDKGDPSTIVFAIHREDCRSDPLFRRDVLQNAHWQEIKTLFEWGCKADEVAFAVRRFIHEGAIFPAKTILDEYGNETVYQAFHPEEIALFLESTDASTRERAMRTLLPHVLPSKKPRSRTKPRSA